MVQLVYARHAVPHRLRRRRWVAVVLTMPVRIRHKVDVPMEPGQEQVMCVSIRVLLAVHHPVQVDIAETVQ